ncbi:uncharacterized protein LOC111886756 [Lactuca sativa]|uniref:Uncharacterized protein n=1 Tax=Lactuca sativa TaxID=4236 RepID=A0A9R1VXF5_LACSA|nr:uncharacterized protein LOC111886756 [Lactuca sativa]KAJ0213123.1 hypothetical protein LSAT_V11C400175090 [Lactuca sativa]
MGPVLDLKGRKDTTMEASTSTDHISAMQTQKYKNIIPENKHEGMGTCINENVEVDIIDCTNDHEYAFDHSQCEDDDTATSSSFDDTFSDLEIHEHEDDNEVMSELHGDAALMPRKKRVTSDWRKFIRPIMWRCKWLELQIQKFQSQAMKYDKELEKDYQRKQLKYKNFESEGQCAKSMPCIHDSHREKPLKRKKRKHEEVDAKLYMSQHTVFSYFATKKSTDKGVVTMDEDQTNSVAATSTEKNVVNEFRVPDELLSLDFRDDYSLEQILWKIEVAETRVGDMATKLESIMTENAGRFPSMEEINLHEANNVLQSKFPKSKGGQSAVASFASQLMKFNTDDDVDDDDDMVKLENDGEGSCLQDVNKPMEEPLVDARKRSTDGILIYNRRAKKPQMDSGGVKIHPMEKLESAKEEISKKTDTPLVSENSSSQNEEPALKIRSVSKLSAPKNKKKRASRARRKSGSSLWTRRNTG